MIRPTYDARPLPYIDALAAIVRREEGREIVEYPLACSNYLSLPWNDIDPAAGERWENFLQSYAMAGLIVSAMRKSCEEAFWRS